MARTVAGRRLTEGHRIDQLSIAVDTARQVRDLWSLLDPTNLTDSTTAWLNATLGVIATNRGRSTRLAASYWRTFRFIETGVTGPPPPPPEFRDDAVRTSLMVTGPVRIRRAQIRSQPIERARDIALTESARAAARHALTGGRELITQAVAADPRARGWARVTSGNACAFCTSLASRGAVFTEASGDFAAHDGCNCSAEPAYS